nr:MAG TPA: hypothetical protein [Caudoviricetes sp.]
MFNSKNVCRNMIGTIFQKSQNLKGFLIKK